MNILLLAHRFPYPPRRGGKIRPFNIIRHLAQTHRVTVCSLARSLEEAEQAHGIAPYCADYHVARVDERLQWARMIAGLPTPLTASGAYFHSAALARTTKRLLATRRYDLVFVHCSSMAHYVQHVQGIPKLLDFGDMDSQKWLEYARHRTAPLSAGYWWEGMRMLAAEKRFARRFDFCTATTRAEWQTLTGYGVDTPSDWFPNGVDSAYFAPADAPYDPDTIAFVGRMDYYPNQQAVNWFCSDVLPAIRHVRPQVQFVIVGAEPPPAIRRLGAISGVSVTGSVADVRPHVARAALTVAPLAIARGTQNKMLESMAMGVPVVATGIAAGGVDAVAGEHLLVADRPGEFATAVLSILADPAMRTRLAVAARDRVLSHHAWPASMRRLDGIIETCLRNFQPVRATARLAG
jgi:sugar transferase (PEP-CTERM/EpsH1 system associated)